MKVISKVRTRYPELYMVTFKYETGVTLDQLMGIANERVRKGYQIVIANRDLDMLNGHKVYIMSKEGKLAEPSSKHEIAKTLVDILGRELK